MLQSPCSKTRYLRPVWAGRLHTHEVIKSHNNLVLCVFSDSVWVCFSSSNHRTNHINYFCMFDALAFGGLIYLERGAPSRGASKGLARSTSLLHQPANPKSAAPTTSLSNAHTPHQYFPCPKSPQGQTPSNKKSPP